jgi:hypothetical protein
MYTKKIMDPVKTLAQGCHSLTSLRARLSPAMQLKPKAILWVKIKKIPVDFSTGI